MDSGGALPTSAEGSLAGARRSSPTSAAGCPQPSPPSPQRSPPSPLPCSSRRTRLHEPAGAGGDEPTGAGGDAALELVAQGGVGWMGGRLQEQMPLHPPSSFPLRSRDLPRLRRRGELHLLRLVVACRLLLLHRRDSGDGGGAAPAPRCEDRSEPGGRVAAGEDGEHAVTDRRRRRRSSSPRAPTRRSRAPVRGGGDELAQSTSTPPGRRPVRTPTAGSRMTSRTLSGLPTMVKTTSEAAVALRPFMTVIVGLRATSR
jgi:hypothetical protein